MASYCLKCGTAMTAGSVICPQCGTVINTISPAEKEALQNELTRRQQNLAKLQEQAALYGQLMLPLHLSNVMEGEELRIAQIQARLAGRVDEQSPATKHFSMATTALIRGDMWEAERFYKMTLSEDPYYPRAKELLEETRRQRRMPRRKSVLAPPKAGSRRTRSGCSVIMFIVMIFGAFTGALIGELVGTSALVGAVCGAIIAVTLVWATMR